MNRCRGPTGRDRQMPVPARADPVGRRPGEDVCRQQLSNPVEERVLRRDEAGGEELGKHVLVERRPNRARSKNRLDFRRKNQLGVGARVVERLDAQPVACQQQTAMRSIPDGKREHAVQALARRPLPLPRRRAGLFRCRTATGSGDRGPPVPAEAGRGCRSRRCAPQRRCRPRCTWVDGQPSTSTIARRR